MKQILTILTLLFFSSSEIFSCSCGELSKISIDEYNEAGEIFIGRVVSVIENKEFWEKEVTFEVFEILKSTESKKEITIRTALGEPACGLSTKVGDKYIFAYYNKKGQLRAGLCGRSINLDKKFKIKDYGLKYAYLEKRAWKKEIKRYRKEKRFIKKQSKLIPALIHPTT